MIVLLCRGAETLQECIFLVAGRTTRWKNVYQRNIYRIPTHLSMVGDSKEHGASRSFPPAGGKFRDPNFCPVSELFVFTLLSIIFQGVQKSPLVSKERDAQIGKNHLLLFRGHFNLLHPSSVALSVIPDFYLNKTIFHEKKGMQKTVPS